MAPTSPHRSWLLAVALLHITGCAAGGSVTAKLELHNNTAAPAAAPLTTQSLHDERVTSLSLSSTRYFAMKLASVYLAEDVDPTTLDNRGQAAMLWVSPHCTSADDCYLFDFARSTDAVNADLNSQGLDVDPGTYRYARMEFCYHGDRPTEANIVWQGGAMPTSHGFLENMCGVTSAEFNPPLVLQPGDSVSVALGYDLSNATQAGDVDPSNPGSNALTADDGQGVAFDDCVVDLSGTTKTCFRMPGFTPGVGQNAAGPAAASVVAPSDDGGSGG
ncbi:MAG TPA: hypothetical protein VGM06_23880 [Polyangiaceae bacterium]|jgi:hypothetical protein